MIKDMRPNVREWLSEPRDFHLKAGGGEPALAREILFAFWEAFPNQGTGEDAMAIRQLNEIAKAAGFENVHRMTGGEAQRLTISATGGLGRTWRDGGGRKVS